MNPITKFTAKRFFLISPVCIAGDFTGIFPSGPALSYTGTVSDSGVSSQENRSIIFTTSTHTLDGVYGYESTGATTGVLRHVSRFESGHFSETEVARITLSFETAATGTYTSSGSYSGENSSGPYSGTFTFSGKFQLSFPYVSRAPPVLDDLNGDLKDNSLWGEDPGGAV